MEKNVIILLLLIQNIVAINNITELLQIDTEIEHRENEADKLTAARKYIISQSFMNRPARKAKSSIEEIAVINLEPEEISCYCFIYLKQQKKRLPAQKAVAVGLKNGTVSVLSLKGTLLFDINLKSSHAVKIGSTPSTNGEDMSLAILTESLELYWIKLDSRIGTANKKRIAGKGDDFTYKAAVIHNQDIATLFENYNINRNKMD